MQIDTSLDGPSPSEVNRYELVTEEMVEEMDEYEEDDIHPSYWTLKEFATTIAAKRTESTAETYLRGLKTFVCFLDTYRNTIRVMEASESDVHDYADWLMNTDWSVNTRESRFGAVQRLYRWAHEQGPLDENLARGLSLQDYKIELGDIEESRGGFNRDEHKFIEREDVVKLWQPENVTSPSVRDSLIIKLMWYTTCRPAAIASMQLEPETSPGDGAKNHDPEEGFFYVDNLKRGDNEAPRRKVYYPTHLNPQIEEWLRRRDALGPHGDSPYLFFTHQSPKMRPSHISRKVKQAAFNVNENEGCNLQEVAGYDVHGKPRWKVTGKTIRHSAITWMVNEAEVPPTHAQAQAGHSKLETTMGYVHQQDELRRNALERAWR